MLQSTKDTVSLFCGHSFLKWNQGNRVIILNSGVYRSVEVEFTGFSGSVNKSE